jgi:quinol monooxygenase YgiN
MYGHIGKFTATEGNEHALLDCLIQASRDVIGTTGLHQYQIFLGEDGAVWAVEIWASREDHDASLQDQATKDLIAAVRPLIASAQSNQLTFQGGLGTDGLWKDASLNSIPAGN